jgi:hypothetical protein
VIFFKGELMDSRGYLKEECYRMKVGQRLVIDRRIFQDAFICGFPSIYETSEQAFLSSMIDSGRGTWRVHRDFEKGDYVVSRHKPSDKRYYIDPDREHLFKKLPDGSLILK